MINSLLKKQLFSSQLFLFGAICSIGIGILLICFQLFLDIAPLFSSDKSLLNNQSIIIHKKINKNAHFTHEEIKKIENENFITTVGYFTPSAYRVIGRVNLPNYSGLSTDMFLEAVPDHFLDNNDKNWKWKKGDKELPIIIPKNYVNLYNFGYAASTGLPQVNDEIIHEIPIELNLLGNLKSITVDAYILGYSEKINSILVPESFIQWSNSYLSNSNNKEISRLILEVPNPSDPKLLTYLKANNYQYISNELKNSKISYILRLILFVVLGIGLIIAFLSLSLIITNINLLILKNKRTICQLYFLGYSVKQISKVYQKIIFKIISIAIFIALCLNFIGKFLYQSKIILFSKTDSNYSIIYSSVIGIVLFILLIFYYKFKIYNKITELVKPNSSMLSIKN